MTETDTDVVDTNVLAVANFRHEGVSQECCLQCIEYLSSAKEKKFALDKGYEIFKEYLRYADMSGKPNVGDSFLKWLWYNHTNPRFCELVEITKSGDEHIIYNEIPFEEGLIGFDKSDQKFLAVCLKSSSSRSKIVNATDSDWIEYGEVIESLGVNVLNLCPDFFTQ